MITWIQVTFQKHTKLIFLFLLLVIAIPFVFTIGAAPGIGKAGHKILERPFFGYNLGSADDQRRIFGDAELSVYLQAGFMALDGSQLQDYALQRVAALHIADVNGLPQPTPKQLTDHLATLRLFQSPEGPFDSKRYTDFTDSLKNNQEITRADVARVLADDVRLQQVQAIISGPGYVLPEEVKSQMVRAMTEWTISVASADFEAFTPDVAVNELNLNAWFDENIARYQIPARVSVDYVSFKPADYMQEVSFTEAELLAFYKANPSRFPGSADDASAATDVDTVPLAFRGAVEAALRTELASKRATRVASDFAYAIFTGGVARGSPALDELIARYKVSRQSAPLFTAAEAPKELGWPATVAQEAFRLSEQKYYSEALPVSDGSAVVLLWNETVPPSTPTLAEVRDAVVRDYTSAERRRLFVDAGNRWRAELQSRVASGMTLEAAAAAMGAPKLEVVNYPAFPRRQPPENVEPAVLSALEQTPTGGISGFIPTGTKGLLVNVISRKEPAVDESTPEYTAAREQLALRAASLGQNLVLAGLVERELGKTADIEP
jgi:peptidyl-prolyl cis-trans isomerase D